MTELLYQTDSYLKEFQPTYPVRRHLARLQHTGHERQHGITAGTEAGPIHVVGHESKGRMNKRLRIELEP